MYCDMTWKPEPDATVILVAVYGDKNRHILRTSRNLTLLKLTNFVRTKNLSLAMKIDTLYTLKNLSLAGGNLIILHS